MYPYSEAQLGAFYLRAAERNQRLADLVLIGGWTGLRWSELRAIPSCGPSESGTSSRFGRAQAGRIRDIGRCWRTTMSTASLYRDHTGHHTNG
jgi:hypothetical protein